MRTNIEIDDRLMEQAMKAAGTRTKRETVEKGLQLLVRMESQKEVRKLRGKVKWHGDLGGWRRD